jgi:hypothetical protein
MQELELNQQRQKGIEGADQPVPGALESIGENLAEGVEAGCRKSGAGTASGIPFCLLWTHSGVTNCPYLLLNFGHFTHAN